MSHFAQAERQALCDLFDEVGPDAPTLCAGWQASDLAAHLVVRERRPDAAAGVLVAALAGYLDRVQRSVRDGRSWPALVAEVRRGPPAVLRPIDEPVNTAEYFIHFEDVRRAVEVWEPRALEAGLEVALWRRARFMARRAGRRLGAVLAVEWPGHGRVVTGAGEPAATVSGPPGELLLYLFGRQAAARVGTAGDPAVVERAGRADLGI